MTRIMALVVMVLLNLHCTYTLRQYRQYTGSEPIIISDRVGEVIDAGEREQFGLFHGIENFESAQFCELHGGGCKIDILSDGQELYVISRDPLTVKILGDYIDAYEIYQDSYEQLEEKWFIIDHDDIGLPITELEVNHVKSKTWRYVCGIGSIVPAYIIGIFISNRISSFVNTGGDLVLLPFAGFVLSGYIIGSKFDSKTVLNSIKIERRLQVRRE